MLSRTSWSVLALGVGVAVWAAGVRGAEPNVGRTDRIGANGRQEASKAQGVSTPEEDLARMQGTWERTGTPAAGQAAGQAEAMRRAVKVIEGNRETVTFYGEGDKVLNAHKVEFKLERYGPVKIFTYYNLEVIGGPNKGQHRPQEQRYIYQIAGDRFCESWGFLPGQEARPPILYVWVKKGSELQSPTAPQGGGERTASERSGPAGEVKGRKQ